MEKQLTTPQQYPLTLNALVAATNQATNRDPVVSLGDDAVLAALDELRGHRLVRVVLPSHGRSVNRYRHVLDEVYGLDASRSGLLATLLLRGPQTVGELRARTERMVDLPSVAAVQDELAVLDEHPEGLARLLPRRPGQKEDRWQQIVAAPWSPDPGSGGGDGVARPPETDRTTDATSDGQAANGGHGESGPDRSAGGATPAPRDELEELRGEVTALREALSVLREEFDALRHGLGD